MSIDLGDFAALFPPAGTRAPKYLDLLGPGDAAPAAIEKLRLVIQTSGARFPHQVDKLLATMDWRPQLVAACAVLVAKSTDMVPHLWSALSKPCWTSPQIAAVLSRVDPEFVQNARLKMDVLCPMDLDEAMAMSGAARHFALGTSSLTGHSAKVLSSLMALCAGKKAADTWLEEMRARENVSQMLEKDTDSGGTIALRWRGRMDAILERAG